MQKPPYRMWLEAIIKFLIVEDELSPADAIMYLGWKRYSKLVTALQIAGG